MDLENLSDVPLQPKVFPMFSVFPYNESNNSSHLPTCNSLTTPPLLSNLQINSAFFWLSIGLVGLMLNSVCGLIFYRLRSRSDVHYFLIAFIFWELIYLISDIYLFCSSAFLNIGLSVYGMALPYVYAMNQVAPIATTWLLLLLTIKRCQIVSRPLQNNVSHEMSARTALVKICGCSLMAAFQGILVKHECFVQNCFTQRNTIEEFDQTEPYKIHETTLELLMTDLRLADWYKLWYKMIFSFAFNTYLPYLINVSILLHISLRKKDSRIFRKSASANQCISKVTDCPTRPRSNPTSPQTQRFAFDCSGRLSPKISQESNEVKGRLSLNNPMNWQTRTIRLKSSENEDSNDDIDEQEMRKISVMSQRRGGVQNSPHQILKNLNMRRPTAPFFGLLSRPTSKRNINRLGERRSAPAFITTGLQYIRPFSSTSSYNNRGSDKLTVPTYLMSVKSSRFSFPTALLSKQAKISNSNKEEDSIDIILICTVLRLLIMALLQTGVYLYELYGTNQTKDRFVADMSLYMGLASMLCISCNILLYILIGNKFRTELACLLRMKKRAFHSDIITAGTLALVASTLHQIHSSTTRRNRAASPGSKSRLSGNQAPSEALTYWV